MLKQVLPLSSILGIRFFGLFIVMPVLSVYALGLDGATPMLVGITMGAYALTQMFFQVPFGKLSDKIGRKTAIFFGLFIFFIGSVICSQSYDIITLMIGRFIQGAGAVSAVTSAMISDLVKEEQRTKAMSIMGGTIGISFIIAMLLSPILAASYSIHTLFDITAALVLVEMVILFAFVPTPPKVHHTYTASSSISEVLQDSNILIMSITNFLQKGVMTITFVITPIYFMKTYGWDKSELVYIYIPSLILAIFAMGAASVLAEVKGKFKFVLLFGIALFGIAYFIFGFIQGEVISIVAVTIFFIGFNMHEPIMQSLTSKYAKVHQRGLALGTFNMFGYAGTFIGGVVGGFGIVNLEILAIVIVVVSLFWLVLIAKMKDPARYKNIYVHYNELSDEEFIHLDKIDGIIEWYKNDTESLLIIKYDDVVVDEETIRGRIH